MICIINIDINDYEIEKEGNCKKVIISFFLLLLAVCCFVWFIKIDKYYVLNCVVLEDLLVCPCEYSYVSKITTNDSFFINNKKYYYEVYSISNDVERKNNTYYKQISLQANLDKQNIDYNVLKIKIILYRENVFFYIKQMIGGDNYERSK